VLRRGPRTRYSRRDLSASTTDAVAHGSMVGFGETYIPAFALAIGAGEVLSGLITTLPMLAGGLMQLASPALAHHFRSRRTWVVVTALGQGLSFVPLAIGAWQGWLPAWLLFAFVSLYWGMGLASGPTWNTWIDSLVPARLRAGYFARRTRLNQVSLVAGIVLGGFALNRASGSNLILPTFAAIFTVAALSRFISVIALGSQREPKPPIKTECPAPYRQTWAELRRLPARRLFLFLFLVQASVMISGPFYNAFMLVRVGMSYGEYLMVLATAYIAKIVALSFLTGYARRLGTARIFSFGALGIIPLPLLWLVSSNFWFLIGVQIISGALWAMYELGMFLVLFDEVPQRKRTEMLTLFNVGNVTATAIGSLLGVVIMKGLAPPEYAYSLIFIFSSLGRGLAWTLFRFVPTSSLATRPMPDRLMREDHANPSPLPRRIEPRHDSVHTLVDSVH
jgi:MFS family permease